LTKEIRVFKPSDRTSQSTNTVKMPYTADLRCSYISVELNMSWFYEALSEMGEEFDFKPTYPRGLDLTEEKAIKWTIEDFEKHIEKAFHDWTVYKVFGHERGEHKYDLYENVWDFLRDVAIDYTEKNDKVIWVNNQEEEESEEDDE